MNPNFEEMTASQKAEEKKLFANALAKRIKEVRIAHGLSQEELAHKAGYYRTYIGHLETAKYSPSVHTVWRIAKAMDMDLGEILKGL